MASSAGFEIWHNNGEAVAADGSAPIFIKILWQPHSEGSYGTVIWGDVDFDGRIDLVTELGVSKNLGGGRFELVAGSPRCSKSCALADIDRALQVKGLRYIPVLMAAIKLSLKFSSKTTIHLATETRFIKVVVCVSILLQLRDLEPVSSATCCVKGRHSAARRQQQRRAAPAPRPGRHSAARRYRAARLL